VAWSFVEVGPPPSYADVYIADVVDSKSDGHSSPKRSTTRGRGSALREHWRQNEMWKARDRDSSSSIAGAGAGSEAAEWTEVVHHIRDTAASPAAVSQALLVLMCGIEGVSGLSVQDNGVGVCGVWTPSSESVGIAAACSSCTPSLPVDSGVSLPQTAGPRHPPTAGPSRPVTAGPILAPTSAAGPPPPPAASPSPPPAASPTTPVSTQLTASPEHLSASSGGRCECSNVDEIPIRVVVRAGRKSQSGGAGSGGVAIILFMRGYRTGRWCEEVAAFAKSVRLGLESVSL
jgi:hypothetical protein